MISKSATMRPVNSRASVMAAAFSQTAALRSPVAACGGWQAPGGPGGRTHGQVLPADWHPGIAVIDHLEPGACRDGSHYSRGRPVRTWVGEPGGPAAPGLSSAT